MKPSGSKFFRYRGVVIVSILCEWIQNLCCYKHPILAFENYKAFHHVQRTLFTPLLLHTSHRFFWKLHGFSPCTKDTFRDLLLLKSHTCFWILQGFSPHTKDTFNFQISKAEIQPRPRGYWSYVSRVANMLACQPGTLKRIVSTGNIRERWERHGQNVCWTVNNSGTEEHSREITQSTRDQ